MTVFVNDDPFYTPLGTLSDGSDDYFCSVRQTVALGPNVANGYRGLEGGSMGTRRLLFFMCPDELTALLSRLLPIHDLSVIIPTWGLHIGRIISPSDHIVFEGYEWIVFVGSPRSIDHEIVVPSMRRMNAAQKGWISIQLPHIVDNTLSMTIIGATSSTTATVSMGWLKESSPR